MDMLTQIIAKLDAIETTQRRGVHLDDVSDDEGELRAPNPNPEHEVEYGEERLLRFLSRVHSKPNVEVTIYDGRLDTNTLLDWISEMEKCFEFEGTPDNKKVKIVATKLKGHASLWCEHF